MGKFPRNSRPPSTCPSAEGKSRSATEVGFGPWAEYIAGRTGKPIPAFSAYDSRRTNGCAGSRRPRMGFHPPGSPEKKSPLRPPAGSLYLSARTWPRNAPTLPARYLKKPETAIRIRIASAAGPDTLSYRRSFLPSWYYLCTGFCDGAQPSRRNGVPGLLVPGNFGCPAIGEGLERQGLHVRHPGQLGP
jgi:hypothetical protein